MLDTVVSDVDLDLTADGGLGGFRGDGQDRLLSGPGSDHSHSVGVLVSNLL